MMTKQALKAVCSFKDEYLLDFINVEELNEQEEDLEDVYKRQILLIPSEKQTQ